MASPYENIQSYNSMAVMQDQLIELWGIEVCLFHMFPDEKVGYESLVPETTTRVKCFIDFSPKRRVFYHFSYFPEDGEDKYVVANVPLNIPVEQGDFIRTGEQSPVGDLIYKVRKIFDEGKYKVLKRTLFLIPIMDATLYERLIWL